MLRSEPSLKRRTFEPSRVYVSTPQTAEVELSANGKSERCARMVPIGPTYRTWCKKNMMMIMMMMMVMMLMMMMKMVKTVMAVMAMMHKR